MPSPQVRYQDLLTVICRRLDTIATLASTTGAGFAHAEAAAFHGRKVIEGIAFGCLVAVEHGLKTVPRDAKGQWNAENIFKSLESKRLVAHPYAGVMRAATEAEAASHGVKVTIDADRERDVSRAEMISIYQRTHAWLHELNPYTTTGRDAHFIAHGATLWSDFSRVDKLLSSHLISISGEAFFCKLRDPKPGEASITALSKLSP